jgi:undecaprenyl-diphosphatase
VLFYYPSDSTFPSNATFVGFAIATAVWLHNRNAGWISYLLALLLGVSRVVGGVHYPSDILGGAVIGVTVAYLVAIKIPLFNRLWSVIIQKLRQLLLA